MGVSDIPSYTRFVMDEELNQCLNSIPGFVAQLEGLTVVPVSSDSRKTRDPVILCIICRVFKDLKSSSPGPKIESHQTPYCVCVCVSLTQIIEAANSSQISTTCSYL